MNPQRRLIDASSNSIANNTNANNILEFDEADAINAHGLRVCGSIEPENVDANANGFWVVYCFPSSIINTTTDLPESFSELDNKDINPYVWGIGCWTASNQAPYHFEFAPRTSRTCQRGARIVVQIRTTGVSAGNVRVNIVTTTFTTS